MQVTRIYYILCITLYVRCRNQSIDGYTCIVFIHLLTYPSHFHMKVNTPTKKLTHTACMYIHKLIN